MQIALTTAAAIAAAPTLVASLKTDPALVLASDASLYSTYGPVTVTSLATSSSLTPTPSPPPPAGALGSCACSLANAPALALAAVATSDTMACGSLVYGSRQPCRSQSFAHGPYRASA